MSDPWAARIVDSAPWRAAESVARRGREAWYRWAGGRPGPPAAPTRNPRARALAALAAAPGRHTAAGRVALLRLAVPAGAYSLAAEVGAELEAELTRLDAATRTRALPPLLGWQLACGRSGDAAALARRYHDELVATSDGVALAELVDPEAPRRVVLPDGRLHAVAIANAIEAGDLDGAGVERLLLRHPGALLRDPQLHLLAANAHRDRDRRGVERALGRALRGYGVAPLRLGPATSPRNLLAELTSAAEAPVDGPLVSIVVASHRAAATLPHALDSLLAQSYHPLEILVGDDASDDGSAELVLDRYGRDARVRIFASERRQGAFNLRNALVAEARGELVTFHDADDLAHPSRIARQVERLRERGAAAVSTTFVRVTPAGRFLFFRDQAAVRLCMITIMTARARFLALGGFRRAWFGADLELYETLRHLHGPAGVDVVRRPLVLGLAREGSLTRRAGAESREDGYRSPARRAYADLVLRRMLGEDVDDAAVDALLAATENLAEPAPVRELRRGGS